MDWREELTRRNAMATKMNAVELKTDEVAGITLVAADPRHSLLCKGECGFSATSLRPAMLFFTLLIRVARALYGTQNR